MSASFITTPKQKGNLYLAASLCDGVEDNDLKQVTTLLIKKDADPNVLMPLLGITPFHLVIGNDSEVFAEEVTKLFLRHGGNPNVRSVDGMTPVHVAAAWGRINILELLLANGGDPHCLDNDYCTPSHYAFQGDHYDAVKIITKYCVKEDEDEKPKFKRELDKVLVNNGEVVAEYILSDDSEKNSFTNDTRASTKMDTSDNMAESGSTNSISINSEFITLRKKRKKTTQDKCNFEIKTEEEKILINEIIAQLSSSIASDIDSSSILKDYESGYSLNEISPPKQKRISMTFNRPKKNNECIKSEEISSHKRRSSTLQVIKQHNHVSYLNNQILRNNLKKSPNISEKNKTPKKNMQSLSKKMTPKEFNSSVLAQENFSYTNKWLDETIISKSPNLVIDNSQRKISKSTKTPMYEKKSSPIFSKMSKKSSVVTPTKLQDRSPKNLDVCLTPVSRIPRPKKYFTTPSHLKTAKRSIETPTKTIIPNKRKANPSEKTASLKKSDHVRSLNQTFNDSELDENFVECNQFQIIDSWKESFKGISMNLDDCMYNDDEDSIRGKRINKKKFNEGKKSENNYLSVFDKECTKRLPRSEFVSGIGMLDSAVTTRSDSKSGSSSSKENTLQSNSQKVETFSNQTVSIKESVREKIQEENEISKDFGKCVDNYSSLMCTRGSNSSESSDSYESLAKNNDISFDIADDKGIDIEPSLSVGNNLIAKDSSSDIDLKREESFLSVEEEYKYEDPEEGILFLERRLCVTPSCASSDMNSSYYSCNTAKSEPLPAELLMLDNVTIREKLKNLGQNPGPITETTHRLYLKRLRKLQLADKQPTQQNSASSNLPNQLIVSNSDSDLLKPSLLSIDWIRNLDDYEANEQKIFQEFHNPNPSRKWREGTSKCSFNYLLLDPRISNDLPRRASGLTMAEKWKIFLSAVFYVGKGKQSRPYAHLYDAFKIWVSKSQHVKSEKIQRILDIWNEGKGVIVLHVFHNTIPVEAYTREAAMIEALGTQKLGNRKCGDYYGVVATWRSKEKCELGKYLLFKALQMLLVEGERQIFPDNL